MRKRGVRKVEAVLLGIGLTLLAVFLGFRIHSFVGSRAALRRFAAITAAPKSGGAGPTRDFDFSLWSDKRIEAYKQSRATSFDEPIAVLTVPKLSLEVPVFEGTDELALNLGAGRIIGTARPGQAGNIGIAGHRDGFFRGLKDLGIGDTIELTTPVSGKSIYAVDKIDITVPDDVSVLRPSEQPALTLVTCYPFYFVGHAPQRYIIRASLTRPALPGSPKPNGEVGTTNKQEASK